MEIVRPTQAPVAWARDLFTFGVTGTNGKTSTVHLLASVLEAAGHPALSVSTVGYALQGQPLSLPTSAQGFLDACARLHQMGGRHAVVECTSQSLAEGYARRWCFDMGVFTNLSADHLATHGSWEHYLASKAQLFTHLGPGRVAVLNAADPYGLMLDKVIPPDVERRLFCSPTRGPALRDADLAVATVAVSVEGTQVTLAPSTWADALGGALSVRMVGEVFAENALAAAAGLAAGLPGEAIARGLAQCPPVAGRFEVLARQPTVVVDYAHEADALERTCNTARTLTHGQLWVVFGAGGDTSGDKRIPMGEAVGRSADVAIVTNDNPRTESPEHIADMLTAGLTTGGRARVERILDRGAAIERAVRSAQPDDIVLIAGKGHETGQIIGEEVVPFSDRERVLQLTGASSS